MLSTQDLKDFMSNPWVQFAIIILTVVGLIAALYSIYLTHKNKKIPYFGIQGTNVIENLESKFNKLELNYIKSDNSKEKIKNFTVTKIIFWNNGHQTIKHDDLADGAPLQIKVKEKSKNMCKILDAEIIHQSSKSNNFSEKISSDGTYVDLDFRYIDHCQGAIVQVLHTGKSVDDIYLDGIIMGCKLKQKKLVSSSKTIIPIKLPFKKSATMKFNLTYYPSLMVLSLLTFEARNYLNNQTTFYDLCIVGIMTLYFIFKQYKEFKRKVPDGFEIFWEKI